MDGPVSDPPPKQEYTLTGVLDFLQKSWVQFELERARWNVEKAELLGKISQLEGERKGHESLKHDLVRRIKMLEYALKQERLRYSQQSEGNTKPNEPPAQTQSPSVSVPPTRLARTAARRETLRKYLQELGSGDIVLVKTPPAFVMPAVLTAGLNKITHQLGTPISHISHPDAPEPSPPTPSPPTDSTPTPAPAEPHTNHISQLEASLSTPPPSSSNPPLTLDSFADSLNSNPSGGGVSLSDFSTMRGGIPDAQELASSLASFAPPPSENPSNGEAQPINTNSNNNIPQSTSKPPDTSSSEQDMEYSNISPASMKRMMGRLKIKGGSGGQLAELRNIMEGGSKGKKDSLGKGEFSESSSGGPVFPPSSSPVLPPIADEKTKATKNAKEGKSALAQELADITLEDDTPNTTISGSRSWKNKYTLRSHFDGVWSLVFHPTEPVLLSASEDGTWKMWNLQTLAPTFHKAPATELEPIYTFRGHTGPVFSLGLNAERGKVLSGGADSTVRVWSLPPSNLDPYEKHGVGVDYHVRTLEGHTDAIWSLALHPFQPKVLTASADDTIRLWDYDHPNPLLHTLILNEGGVTHTPTSVDVIQTDSTRCVAAYTSASLAVFDLETGRPVLTLMQNQPRGAQINKVISHPTLPLAITAHEDKKISFVDLKSGTNVHTMVGHLESVAALAVDPSALYLLSAGHDSSLRFWDITTRTCVQEVTAHRPKYNESIHSVAYHPSKTFVASGGADSTVRIYM